MNLLNSKIWILALCLAGPSIFAQTKCRPQKSFEQGHELTQSQLMAGYNYPACIELQDSWDLYATASFIYWQAREENIEIGLISQNFPETGPLLSDLPFTTSYKNNMSITSPNFTYRPGFKFGFGGKLGYDGWDAYIGYTWFHGSIGSGVKPLAKSNSPASPPNGKYLYPIQGAMDFGSSLFFQDADQSWNIKMDLLDISMGRSYYSGTRLTFHPFFGARGAWIRQELDTTYVGSTNYLSAFAGYLEADLHNEITSWGVGPRAGFESNWLLGYGVRLIGNGSLDLLYTRYEVQENDQIFSLAPAGYLGGNPIRQNASVSQTIDYLRTHTDLEMGFGWGSYFDHDNWHVDLSATYCFQIFWDQNMFRNYESTLDQAKSFAPNGNLYIHGLSMNARLDF